MAYRSRVLYSASFDELIRGKGYRNRSEAIRDLIRDNLVKQEWQSAKKTVGVITIVYNHHTRELSRALTRTSAYVLQKHHLHHPYSSGSAQLPRSPGREGERERAEEHGRPAHRDQGGKTRQLVPQHNRKGPGVKSGSADNLRSCLAPESVRTTRGGASVL